MTREHSGIERSLDESLAVLRAARADATLIRETQRFVDRASEVLKRGGRLLVCGNGGSLSQANHFAEEWVGRFRGDRPALPALALSDPATITCIANDYGFEQIFSRQIEAHARAEDLLVVLSTSGRSRNILAAARTARRIGIASVALTGPTGEALAREVDIAILVPLGSHADPIQECHLTLLHTVIEGVETQLFGKPPARGEVDAPTSAPTPDPGAERYA